MKTNVHSLLRRQIKRYLGEQALSAPLRQMIDAVNSAYYEFDADRGMLERSLDLSSQELLQANSEMRAIFQAIPDLLFRIDHEGTILSFKVGNLEDMIRQPKDLIGCRIQDIPEKNIAEKFAGAIEQLNRNRTTVSIEYDLKRENRLQTYEARLIPAAGEQIVVIIRNITERSRAEALRVGQNEVLEMIASGCSFSDVMNRLAQVVESQSPEMRCAVMLLEPNHQILSCCAAPSMSTGMLQAIMHIPVGENSGSCGRAAFRNEMVIVADTETDLLWKEWQDLVTRHNIRSCWSVPIRARQGGILGTFAMFKQVPYVPEEKEIQMVEVAARIAGIAIEGRRMAENLVQSQKMEAFGQLAGGIANDFNNLLTVIIGNLSIFRMAGFSEEEREVALDEITGAADRASQLLSQLLTFSRRQPISMKPLDINEVVAEITTMLLRLVGENIQLETESAPGGAPVRADRNLIEQVILNLVINARDAMPKGGRLSLRTQIVEISEAEIKDRPGARSGKKVRLSISDNGAGIPPEHLTHIFEPFFTTKGIGRGSGLGLSTVFSIVEQHRGWTEVESKVGLGTTFSIFLPYRVQSAESSLSKTIPAQMILEGKETILLLEEESPVHTLTINILKRYGYKVLTASTGTHALELWKNHRDEVNLLITDMFLPGGLNGLELAKLMREKKPHLKVIYCGEVTDGITNSPSWVRSEDFFLEKPLNFTFLLKRVRSALDEP